MQSYKGYTVSHCIVHNKGFERTQSKQPIALRRCYVTLSSDYVSNSQLQPLGAYHLSLTTLFSLQRL